MFSLPTRAETEVCFVWPHMANENTSQEREELGIPDFLKYLLGILCLLKITRNVIFTEKTDKIELSVNWDFSEIF